MVSSLGVIQKRALRGGGSIESWSVALIDNYIVFLCDLLNAFLCQVHGLCLLSHELHSDLRSVEDMSANLPLNHTEIYLKLLENVNGSVKELGVEEMTIEDDCGESDTSS